MRHPRRRRLVPWLPHQCSASMCMRSASGRGVSSGLMTNPPTIRAHIPSQASSCLPLWCETTIASVSRCTPVVGVADDADLPGMRTLLSSGRWSAPTASESQGNMPPRRAGSTVKRTEGDPEWRLPLGRPLRFTTRSRPTGSETAYATTAPMRRVSGGRRAACEGCPSDGTARAARIRVPLTPDT